jgi:signal transduction histidine kinase
MDTSVGSQSLSPEPSSAESVAELRARLEELERQVVARDNLLAVAAHELRNPMHAILLQVTAALAIAKRDRQSELVPKIERIRHIVDVYVKRATLLLDSVRLDANAWAADRREVDLCAVVRDICNSYEPEAAFAGSPVSLSLPPRLVGHWDRLAIEQVVANLVSNAIKYGAGAPIEVSVKAEGDQAELIVRDGGVGIAESDRSRIFERFQQAIGSSEKRSGFGIGLWLVRSLVEAHGGTIDVHSEYGRGSTFVVRLPSARDSG